MSTPQQKLGNDRRSGSRLRLCVAHNPGYLRVKVAARFGMLGFHLVFITASTRRLLGRRANQDIATPLATSHHVFVATSGLPATPFTPVDPTTDDRLASQALHFNGPIATRNPLAGTSLPDKSANTFLCFRIITAGAVPPRITTSLEHTTTDRNRTRSDFAAV